MKPDIVPVQFSTHSEEKQLVKLNQSNSTLAASVAIGQVKIEIHNGIDKYILFTLLKELK